MLISIRSFIDSPSSGEVGSLREGGSHHRWKPKHGALAQYPFTKTTEGITILRSRHAILVLRSWPLALTSHIGRGGADFRNVPLGMCMWSSVLAHNRLNCWVQPPLMSHQFCSTRYPRIPTSIRMFPFFTARVARGSSRPLIRRFSSSNYEILGLLEVGHEARHRKQPRRGRGVHKGLQKEWNKRSHHHFFVVLNAKATPPWERGVGDICSPLSHYSSPPSNFTS